jgi:hypothetical protein
MLSMRELLDQMLVNPSMPDPSTTIIIHAKATASALRDRTGRKGREATRT